MVAGRLAIVWMSESVEEVQCVARESKDCKEVSKVSKQDYD